MLYESLSQYTDSIKKRISTEAEYIRIIVWQKYFCKQSGENWSWQIMPWTRVFSKTIFLIKQKSTCGTTPAT